MSIYWEFDIEIQGKVKTIKFPPNKQKAIEDAYKKNPNNPEYSDNLSQHVINFKDMTWRFQNKSPKENRKVQIIRRTPVYK